MTRHRSLRFAAVGGLLGFLIVASPVVAGSSAGVQIGETNNLYHFAPTSVFVNVGGTVLWTNGSDAAHTVTSDAGSELASSTIGAGTIFSHTFATAGSFAYHCSIHTYMVGKVVVLAAGVTPPPTDTVAAVGPGSGGIGPRLAFLVLIALGGALLALRRYRLAG
jgi:plastocyanin